MIGVLAYGGYLPRYRLDRKAIVAAMGWSNPATYGLARGERTVANHDEDSLTMAVEACAGCLDGVDRSAVDALFLGSTTLPFAERQGATMVASALDLRPDIRTVDVTGTHRAGTSALLSAFDAVGAEGTGQVLVAASECRTARAGGNDEHLFGDGAAALLVGDGAPVAVLKASHSVSVDFVDGYREPGATHTRGWEDRFVRDEGFKTILVDAVRAFLDKIDLPIDDFAKVVFPCRYTRDHGGIARTLGVVPETLVSPMMDVVGDTGAAHPLLMLAAALEDAEPWDKILVAGFGNGCDVFYLQVTQRIEQLRTRRVTESLARRADLGSYEKYRVFRGLTDTDVGIRGELEAPTALSALWRDHRTVFGLVGSRCTACGMPQFPPQRICANPECGAADRAEPYRFSDRRGTIFTYTGDHLASSVEPPQIYGVVDVDGGGRLFVDFTDCTLADLRVGQPVRMTLRRKYRDRLRGLSGYFWKATPADAAAAGEERTDG